MQIRDNFIVLFIAGCFISVVTFSLSALTQHLMNGNPAELNISWSDVIDVVVAGIAFAIFMKTVKVKSKKV